MMYALPKPRTLAGIATDLLTPTPVRDDNGVLWCGQCRKHPIGNDTLRESAVCPTCKEKQT